MRFPVKLAPAVIAGAAFLAGCSGASHAGSTQQPVTSNQGAVATTIPATPTTSVAGTGGQTQTDTAGQISAIQSDLSGSDTASGQADSDLSAAAAAQSQNDSP